MKMMSFSQTLAASHESVVVRWFIYFEVFVNTAVEIVERILNLE